MWKRYRNKNQIKNLQGSAIGRVTPERKLKKKVENFYRFIFLILTLLFRLKYTFECQFQGPGSENVLLFEVNFGKG